MRHLWWSLVAGCGAPISNQVFLEEAKFLGALPTQARFAAPAQILLAPAGDAPALVAAKQVATDWNDRFGLLASAGEQLRETPADVATAVKRRWESVGVARRIVGTSLGRDPDVVEYWVQAEILRPKDGDASWTLALADAPDGPWTGVASGTHRTQQEVGLGDLTFDLTPMAVIVGGRPEAPLGVFDATYHDANPEYDGARSVEAAQTLFPGIVLAHGLVGESVFAFTGELALADDGSTRAGYAVVLHDERGGWGEGLLQGATEEEVLAWESCWSVQGGLLWQAGDPGVATAGGDPSACPVLDPF
jgi:hypothetical protein